MKTSKSFLLMVVIGLLMSCGTNGAKKERAEWKGSIAESIIGDWEIDDIKTVDDVGELAMAKMLLKAIANSLVVSFDSDGNMTGKFSFMGIEEEQSGKYKVEGDTLITDIDGKLQKMLIRSLDTSRIVVSPIESDFKEDIEELIFHRKK